MAIKRGIEVKTITQQVYDIIVDMIISQELKPGAKVTEADILDIINTSRTPVREALRQLAADHYLTCIPNKGYFVKEYDADRGHSLYVVVSCLDAFAAELALPYLTAKDHARMQEHIARMDDAIAGNDVFAYESNQESFHAVYRAKCGNQPLLDLLAETEKNAQRAVALRKGRMEKSMPLFNDEHRQILKLIKEGDVNKVRDAIRAHWSKAY